MAALSPAQVTDVGVKLLNQVIPADSPHRPLVDTLQAVYAGNRTATDAEMQAVAAPLLQRHANLQQQLAEAEAAAQVANTALQAARSSQDASAQLIAVLGLA